LPGAGSAFVSTKSHVPVVRFHRLAEYDLDEVWEYIANDSVDAADRLVLLIKQKCDLLAEFPGMGRERAELAPGLRSFPAASFVIFYLPEPDGIAVVRVLSGYRDIHAVFHPEQS
jgi:toxin ParE1/3/4